MREIRIFLAAPDDVEEERRRLERLLERFNESLAGTAVLRVLENHPALYGDPAADADDLINPGDCDLVLAMFRGRVGIEPPIGFVRMEDGQGYPSTIAYELATAFAARERSGRPEVHVLRHQMPQLGAVDLDNAARLSQLQRQWGRLKVFLDQLVPAEGLHGESGVRLYLDLDEFETQVTGLLRNWLDDHVIAPRESIWPTANKGSPFCGLSAFGTRHASVFFGRDGDLGRALETLRTCSRADDRLPFLLVVGPSAVGKTSLARAGIVPRLTTPGSVLEVDNWRVAQLRPGDNPDGPLAELAERLFDGLEDIPEQDLGRPEALPELSRGETPTPESLANRLADGDTTSVAPVLRALDMAGLVQASLRGDGRPVRTDLLLVVDSLDDLFTSETTTSDRGDFVNALWALAATRRVWIVATLRAETYHHFVATPQLAALKNWGDTIDLAPPGEAELMAMIRRPAEAAALTLENHPTTGEPLADHLLSLLPGRYALPALQYTLDRLYQDRFRTEDGDQILTFQALDRLGSPNGLIDRFAEATLDGLPDTVRAELPWLIRQLVGGDWQQVAMTGGSLTGVLLRTVERARLEPSVHGDQLLAALTEAGVIEHERIGESQRLRLAHVQVYWQWRRLSEDLRASNRWATIREQVEQDLLAWSQAGGPDRLLIPPGRRLGYAEDLVRQMGADLPHEMVQYVEASRRRARAGTRRIAMIAASLLVLTVAAGAWGYQAWVGERQAAGVSQQAQERAEQAERERIAAVNRADQAEKQRIAAQTRAEDAESKASEAAEQARLAREKASQATERADQAEHLADQATTRHRQVRDTLKAMLDGTLRAFDSDAGLSAGQAANLLARIEDAVATLAAADAADSELKDWLETHWGQWGTAYLRLGALDRAGQALERNLALQRERTAANEDARPALADALGLIADLHHRRGQQSEAIAAIEEAITLHRALVQDLPENLDRRAALAVDLETLAAFYESTNNLPAALPVLEEALALRRALVADDSNNSSYQRDLANLLDQMAAMRSAVGDLAGARAVREQVSALRRQLLEAAPDDPANQDALAIALERLAGLLAEDDRAAAITLLREVVGLRTRLAAADPDDGDRQADLITARDRLSQLLPKTAQEAESLDPESRVLVLRRRLETSPEDSSLRRRLAETLEELVGRSLETGEDAQALSWAEEAAKLREALAAGEDAGPMDRHARAAVLRLLGDAKRATGDNDAARRAYETAIELHKAQIESDGPDRRWLMALAVALERLGILDRDSGDRAAAARAFDQALEMRQQLLNRASGADAVALLAAQHGLYNRLADLRRRQGDRAGARRAYEDGIALVTHEAAPASLPSEWQWQFSVGREGLGDLDRDDGNMQAALDSYQVALDLRRVLTARRPDQAEWRRGEERVRTKIEAARGADGQPKPAQSGLESSLSDRRALLAEDPDNPVLIADLMRTLERVADGHRRSDDRNAAASYLEEALALHERLPPGERRATETAHLLTRVLLGLGEIRAAASDWEKASAALTLSESQLDDWPDAPLDLRLRLLDAVAATRAGQGDSDAAEKLRAEALEMERRRLRDMAPTDPAWADLAVRLEDLGTAREAAGDQAGALTAWEEALSLRRRLADGPGGDPPALIALLGRTAAIKTAMGDAEGARSDYQQMLALQRRNTGSSESTEALLRTLMALGQSAAATNPETALGHYREALPLAESLAATEGGNAEYAEILRRVKTRLAELDSAVNPEPGTLEALETELPADRDKIKTDPPHRQRLARKLVRIAELRADRGDQPGARAALDESLTHWRKLAAEDGDLRPELLNALRRFATAQLGLGDQEGARVTLNEALGLARDMAQAETASPDLALAVLEIGDQLAALQRQLGNAEDALGLYEHNLAKRRAMTGEAAGDADLLLALSRNLEQVILLRRSVGDMAAALEADQEKLETDRQLIALRPDDAALRGQLAVTQGRIGESQAMAGDLAEAERNLAESLTVLRERALAKSDEAWKFHLVDALTRSSDLALAQGKPDRAVTLMGEAVNILDKMAPSRSSPSRLGDPIMRLTRAQLAAGQPAQALASADILVDYSAKLAEAGAEEVDTTFLMAVGQGLRAEALLAQDRRPGVLTGIADSLRTLTQLVEDDPENSAYRDELSRAYAREADLEDRVGNARYAAESYRKSLAHLERVIHDDRARKQVRLDRVFRRAELLTQLARITPDDAEKDISLNRARIILSDLAKDGRLYPRYEPLLEALGQRAE